MDGPLVGVFLPRASNRPASFSGMGGHGKYAGKLGETMINMDLASNCVLMTSFSISIFSAPGLARWFFFETEKHTDCKWKYILVFGF